MEQKQETATVGATHSTALTFLQNLALNARERAKAKLLTHNFLVLEGEWGSGSL